MKAKIDCICGRTYELDLTVSNYKRCKQCGHKNAYIDHLLGKNINGYVVGNVVRTGSHGTVFRVANNLDIVIKIISEKVRATARIPVLEAILRFEINHANMVELIEYGLYNGFLWYVIPYCEGRTINKMSAQTWSTVSNNIKCKLIEDLIGVPILLEKNKLIHKDLQESNIMYSGDVLKVIDIDSINFEDQAYPDPVDLFNKKRHYFYRLTWMLILLFSGRSFKEVRKIRQAKDRDKIEQFILDKRFDPIRSFVQNCLHEEECMIRNFAELSANLFALRGKVN